MQLNVDKLCCTKYLVNVWFGSFQAFLSYKYVNVEKIKILNYNYSLREKFHSIKIIVRRRSRYFSFLHTSQSTAHYIVHDIAKNLMIRDHIVRTYPGTTL